MPPFSVGRLLHTLVQLPFKLQFNGYVKVTLTVCTRLEMGGKIVVVTDTMGMFQYIFIFSLIVLRQVKNFNGE